MLFDKSRSLKHKFLDFAAYGLLTACFSAAGIYYGLVKGHGLGFEKGFDEGRVCGEFTGYLDGLIEGKKKSLVVVDALVVGDDSGYRVEKLSGEDYFKKLFEYQLEKKFVLRACRISLEDYLNKNSGAGGFEWCSLLANKCSAEIKLIDNVFKNKESFDVSE